MMAKRLRDAPVDEWGRKPRKLNTADADAQLAEFDRLHRLLEDEVLGSADRASRLAALDAANRRDMTAATPALRGGGRRG